MSGNNKQRSLIREVTATLTQRLQHVQIRHPETFHQMLFRLIDESGMSYPEVYTRANMSKKLFSKLKRDPDRIPKKKNVLALAIALRLDLAQTKELLMTAGYALSDSSTVDVIVSYYIEKGKHDIFEINEALFDKGFENDLLGF